MDVSVGIEQEALDAVFDKAGMNLPSQEQKRKFVVALFDCDYNAAEAMRMTGYSGNNERQRAWQYMQCPYVKRSISLLADELAKHNKVRQDYVLRKMLKGAELAEDQNNLTALARFVEMIGKHLGMFKEQVELSGKDGKAIEIEQRTKEDVSAFKSAIDGLAKRGGEGRTSLETKH